MEQLPHGLENVYQYCDTEPQPRDGAPRQRVDSTWATSPTGRTPGGSAPRAAESKGARLEAIRRHRARQRVVGGTSPTGFEPVFWP